MLLPEEWTRIDRATFAAARYGMTGAERVLPYRVPDPDVIAALTDAIRELASRVDAQMWPRWLSVEAAARYCSLGQKSIRNLCASGRLTASRAVRGKVLIDRLQLDAVLSAECGARLRRGRGIHKN